MGAPVQIAVRLTPSDWLAAAPSEGRKLLVPVPAEAKPGEAVALHVELAGHLARATVFGIAGAMRPAPSGRKLELVTAPESLPAVGLLTAAARGEPVSFRDRPRRYKASLPAVVEGKTFMVATSVSEGGCALRWSGPPPVPGRAIRVRIGTGSGVAQMNGVVRWVKGGKETTSVGVRLSPAEGQARAWQLLVDQVRRSGAASS